MIALWETYTERLICVATCWSKMTICCKQHLSSWFHGKEHSWWSHCVIGVSWHRLEHLMPTESHLNARPYSAANQKHSFMTAVQSFSKWYFQHDNDKSIHYRSSRKKNDNDFSRLCWAFNEQMSSDGKCAAQINVNKMFKNSVTHKTWIITEILNKQRNYTKTVFFQNAKVKLKSQKSIATHPLPKVQMDT